MNANNEYIDDLMTTYLSEGLPANELKELKEWIADSPANKRLFMQKQEIWFSNVCRDKTVAFDSTKAYQQFCSRRKKGSKARVIAFNRQIFYRVAVVALVVCVSLLSYWQGGVSVTKQFADTTIEAPLGAKTKLYLPDGTLAWLNAGSKLVYSQGFGVENRSVHLVGEAYFEVVKNKDLPFKVHTTDLGIQVYGTKFNIRNYTEDDEVVVNLLEGKISLQDVYREKNICYMAPGEKAVLNKKTKELRKTITKQANVIEWTKGYLFFDEDLLVDIAKKLEREYSVEIEIDNDSLRGYRFYGSFIVKDNSLESVLDALTATEHLKYKQEGNKIVLYK
ncbi:MAG: FecR family protein [Bacteroidaceae bacterium]|nr:FecR family protein [Bacteroidaceae bacterium]